MFVRNWMSSPPAVVPPDAPAEAALGFMETRQVRRLPVVDEGRLVGIVTKSDLEAALGRGNDLHGGPGRVVAQVMTRNPLTVEPGDTLERAAQLMREKKVSGLPVLEGGRVKGIITESDIFGALCDIMGLGEKGARVVMTVREDEDLLREIGKRLNGLVMRSLVTVHDASRGCWNVVLRVRGRAAARKQAM